MEVQALITCVPGVGKVTVPIVTDDSVAPGNTLPVHKYDV
ncbi:hypothetical protein SDC9_82301 [bioreactor metagenome]|uniref:Uncharacterized protein n=1 Tax=bioreactor metagenome TaxID=1076179 RepID=A0A644Z603_9ZZZZ